MSSTHILKKIGRNIVRPIRKYLFKTLQDTLSHSNTLFLLRLKKCINFFSQNDQKIDILSLEYLDTQKFNRIQTLRSELQSITYAPKNFQQPQTFASIRLPAVETYLFENAIIHIGSSSLLLNEQVIVVERLLDADPKICDYSSGFLLMHDTMRGLISKNLADDSLSNGIFLGGNGSWSYYHWMIEILPKIQLLEKLPKEFDNFPLLFSQEVRNIASFKESLNAFNIKRPFIFLNTTQCYSIKNIIYISALNNLVFNISGSWSLAFNYFYDKSIFFIRDNLLTYAKQDDIAQSVYPQKLFLARKNVRREYNQDEVFKVLEEYGFSKIFIEDYTLQDQIRLFNRASHIVGSTGAAWTNLIFCDSHVRCLCWMPEQFNNFSAFATLAKICEVSLEYIPFETDVLSKTVHESKYKLDINLMRNWLEV